MFYRYTYYTYKYRAVSSSLEVADLRNSACKYLDLLLDSIFYSYWNPVIVFRFMASYQCPMAARTQILFNLKRNWHNHMIYLAAFNGAFRRPFNVLQHYYFCIACVAQKYSAWFKHFFLSSFERFGLELRSIRILFFLIFLYNIWLYIINISSSSISKYPTSTDFL